MPHHLKYVPAHSGSTASRPSRANRRTSSHASHGFFSCFRRSTFCALVSFGATADGVAEDGTTGTSVLKADLQDLSREPYAISASQWLFRRGLVRARAKAAPLPQQATTTTGGGANTH